MTIVEISVKQEPYQFPGDPRNYTVTEAAGWDLGHPIGSGDSIDEAISDFKSSWELTYDEEIDVVII